MSLKKTLLKNRMPVIYLIWATLLVMSCKSTGTLYTPTAANANKDATLDELTQGHTLYLATCGKCHKLHNPKDHDSKGWTATLVKMQKKAKIDDQKRDLIFKYLTHYKKS